MLHRLIVGDLLMFQFLVRLFSKLFLFTGKIGDGRAFAMPLSAERESELFELLRSGNQQQKKYAEEELAVHNMRLVAHISKKYVGSGVSHDELTSIGSIGLVKAIRTFSSDKANFSTYASRCIANEILMFFRANKKNQVVISFEDAIGSDKDSNEITLGEVLSDGGCSVEDAVFAREELEKLNRAIKTRLDKRETQILSLRFGLYGNLPHTQKEVAKMLGISRSYVSRIETAAVEKIRAKD